MGPSPATAQHRESTFHWALQTYRDLLAYIHQVKRQKQQAGQSQSSQTRPSFYPKPPKLSGAPFPSPSNAEVDPQPDDHTPRPSISYAPSTSSYNEPSHERTMQGPSSYPMPHSNDRPDILRRSSGSQTSITSSPGAQDSSPPSRAINALAIISELCQETDWQWIDGMHLGGCLAYGLANYPKAQRWYNKVLELDPK